jgi:hypothetical protein
MKKFFVALFTSLIITAVLVPSSQAQWKTKKNVDEMEGTVTHYAISPNTPTTNNLSFPYQNLQMNLVVACNKSDVWSYLVFNKTANIQDTDYDSEGRQTFNSRIKWDDTIKNYEYVSEAGSRFVYFRYQTHTNLIKSSNTALVEMKWYGAGSVYFQVDLSGSSSAINTIMSECNQ